MCRSSGNREALLACEFVCCGENPTCPHNTRAIGKRFYVLLRSLTPAGERGRFLRVNRDFVQTFVGNLRSGRCVFTIRGARSREGEVDVDSDAYAFVALDVQPSLNARMIIAMLVRASPDRSSFVLKNARVAWPAPRDMNRDRRCRISRSRLEAIRRRSLRKYSVQPQFSVLDSSDEAVELETVDNPDSMAFGEFHDPAPLEHPRGAADRLRRESEVIGHV